MFTCSQCSLEKPDSEKSEISELLKFGFVVGSFIFLAPKWRPGDTCDKCGQRVTIIGFISLLLIGFFLFVAIVAGLYKAFHS